MNRLWLISLLLAGTVVAPPAGASHPTLQILPGELELNGPQARQQLLAQAVFAGHEEDWLGRVTWRSDQPQVARVDPSGVVRAVGDGETLLRAASGELEATVAVRVRGTQQPFVWSFRNHVIPVLTKQGCNQGSCHGALAGKNGLKLTLRGYDPVADHLTLTREATARRVTLADPAASMMLLKPTLAMPHGGGKRLEAGSLEYQVIAEWIASGAPAPAPDEPRVVDIEVLPSRAVLSPEAEQHLAVRARYSDGSLSDVTRWAKYQSTDSAVAEVDDLGLVRMTAPGEAVIAVWYSNKVRTARLMVPHPNDVTEQDYSHFERRNYIDELVLAKLEKLRILPSQPATDSEFLRRAFLDTVGLLPTAAEVAEFLADDAPNKREKLIARLLEKDAFVDHWAYKWSDLLLVSSDRLPRESVWDFYNWIRESVRENKPWDEFARDIFSASGATRDHGALNYFRLHQNVIELAENTTQAFLGTRLTCARCHNHPLAKWTQNQYYQFANLFTRVGLKAGPEPADVVVFTRAFGDINHPRLLRPLPPAPLDGEALPLEGAADRRLHFTHWLTSPENPYFARNLVSRVWANFFARGLVEPEDDLSAMNPVSNEELFDALTSDFVEHGFDVKHLIRAILNSSTYQLSSDPNSTNQKDEKFYSRFVVKRLPAEVLLDAYSQVTAVPTQFEGYPLGMRAQQLPDVRVASQFLDVFGRPPRKVCDVKERSSAPSISQALHVINGDTLNKKLRAENNVIRMFETMGLGKTHLAEHLYLSIFSRYPTEAERREATEYLAAEGSDATLQRAVKRERLEDLMWSMLTSKEFLFNH